MDAVFICRKCEHHLFIETDGLIGVLEKLPEYDCPSCGEEGYQNWIFSHVGDSDKEKDNYRKWL